jgi:hypothetical protein
VAWIHPINFGSIDDQDWAHLIATLFDHLRTAGTAVVPVVTIDEVPEVYVELRRVITSDGRGLVLRLDCEDTLEADPADLRDSIDALLADCGVTPEECDVVLDAGLVDGGAAIQSGAAGTALGSMPYTTRWRNIGVAFSAFPDLIGSHVAPSSVGSISRTDAAAFNHLAARWTQTPLIFGDYGVGVPTYSDAKWSPIPNIRYAVSGEWIIHRAATKSNPSPQYIELARNLAGTAYFSGRGFSPGDDYISDVAAGVDGPGNAGSYLKAAMSRHFHVVLDSLATHGAP